MLPVLGFAVDNPQHIKALGKYSVIWMEAR